MSPLTRLRALAPLLGFAMSIALTLTALITWLNIGWNERFMPHWLHAAALALCIMLPLGGLIMAGVSRLVNRALADRSTGLRRLVAALLMGMAMEAVASAITTGTNLGIGAHFAADWAHAYVRALPLGLCLGLVMGFAVQPWVERRIARAQWAATPSANPLAHQPDASLQPTPHEA